MNAEAFLFHVCTMPPVTWLGISLAAAGAVILCVLVAAIVGWRSTSAADRAEVSRISRLGWRDKLRLATRLACDGRIPPVVRAVPPLVVVYLAMPLDVVPDFIPVAGQLDDLVVIALGVGLLVRFTPRELLREAMDEIEARTARAARSR